MQYACGAAPLSSGRGAAGRPNLALRVGVLPRQAEIEHEDVPHGRRCPAHSEVGRLYVPVQEAHFVDGLYSFEDLKVRESFNFVPSFHGHAIRIAMSTTLL